MTRPSLRRALTSKPETRPVARSMLASSSSLDGSTNMSISAMHLPTTSSRARPSSHRNASLTSDILRSGKTEIVIMAGLLRNIFSRRSFASRSSVMFLDMPKKQSDPSHWPNQMRVSTGSLRRSSSAEEACRWRLRRAASPRRSVRPPFGFRDGARPARASSRVPRKSIQGSSSPCRSRRAGARPACPRTACRSSIRRMSGNSLRSNAATDSLSRKASSVFFCFVMSAMVPTMRMARPSESRSTTCPRSRTHRMRPFRWRILWMLS